MKIIKVLYLKTQIASVPLPLWQCVAAGLVQRSPCHSSWNPWPKVYVLIIGWDKYIQILYTMYTVFERNDIWICWGVGIFTNPVQNLYRFPIMIWTACWHGRFKAAGADKPRSPESKESAGHPVIGWTLSLSASLGLSLAYRLIGWRSKSELGSMQSITHLIMLSTCDPFIAEAIRNEPHKISSCEKGCSEKGFVW